MSKPPLRSIQIDLSDPVLQRAVSATCATQGWQVEELQASARHTLTDADIQNWPRPFRIGALLDALEDADRASRQMPDVLRVGRVCVSTVESTYTDDMHADVRLSDKERALLSALLQAPDHKMLRDDLLHHVWGYVPGVETHTLETTIYRLRQKIEADPDAPKRLRTIPDGYQFDPS